MPPPLAAALGIDVGTTNTKVVLAAIGNDGVAVQHAATAPTPPPARLAATLAELVGRVTAAGPTPVAVGIASMAETGVPLDADGRPLGDWLRWDGHRAGAEASELADRLGWTELVRATGTRPGPKVPLATWLWLRHHEPDRFAALSRWSGVADLAALLLTGRLVTDHTLAGRTMAYRRPDGGRLPEAFDRELLAEVGLRPDQVPDVVPAGVAGKVRDFPGLPAGTPVTVAGHDHAVGAYAAGTREPGDVADSVGTAEAVLTVVAEAPDEVAVARAGMSSVVTADARHPAVLAGSPAAGAFVEWWRDREGDPLEPVAVLAGPEPLLVLPYLHGRQAPYPDPAARPRVIGDESDPARRARAMLQGLCLQAHWIRSEQARLAGVAADGPLAVFGGPVAANPAWLRLKAAVAGSPVRLVTEPEAVAAGAALLAAVRAGLVPPPGPELPSRPVPVPEPRPDFAPTLAAFVAAATGAPS